MKTASDEIESRAPSTKSHAKWAIAGRLVQLVFNVASTLVISRLLAPEDFGRFFIVRITMVGFGTLGGFGLGTFALQHLAKIADTHSRLPAVLALTRAAMGPAFIASFLAFLFAVLAGPTIFPSDSVWQVGIILAAGVFATAIGELGCQIARGLNLVATANMLGGLRGGAIMNASFLSLIGLAASQGWLTWQSSIGIYAITVAGTGAITWCLCLSALVQDHGEHSAEQLTTSSLLAVTWPLAATAVLSFLSGQADIFFAGLLPTDSDVAGYVAARRVVLLLSIPLTILAPFLMGVIGPLWAKSEHKKLQRVMQTGATLAGLPFLFAASFVIVFPEIVLTTVLGPGYENGAASLRVMSIGQFALVLTGGCGILLSLTGHERIQMQIVLVTTIVTCIGGFVAARYGGAVWLACIASVTTILMNLTIWLIAFRRLRINTAMTFGSIASLLTNGIEVIRKRKALRN